MTSHNLEDGVGFDSIFHLIDGDGGAFAKDLPSNGKSSSIESKLWTPEAESL